MASRMSDSAYGYRDDEFGGFTSAESCRRARVYEQRMRDGAWHAMDSCVLRFQEIIRPHLAIPCGAFQVPAPTPVAADWALFELASA